MRERERERGGGGGEERERGREGERLRQRQREITRTHIIILYCNLILHAKHGGFSLDGIKGTKCKQALKGEMKDYAVGETEQSLR